MATKFKPHPFGPEWRLNGKTVQHRVKVPIVYVERELETFIAQLRTACEGLSDPTIDMETEYGTYGERDTDVLTVTGWREATQAETDKALREVQDNEKYRETYEANMIAELKKTRPELFKET